MPHKPAASTLIRLHLEKHGLVERDDYRITSRKNKSVFLSFSDEATGNLLTIHGSVDKVLAFVTAVPDLNLEAQNVHLNLQMELVEKE